MYRVRRTRYIWKCSVLSSMSKLTKIVYLTIHGHFYQPPRENPWTGKIELQPEAAPFHDWNDRILIQCYQPNAMARIVDSHGRILEIVNNFRLLSFNIGPTLFEWLERHAPVVYHRILEGDRLSLLERSGHGNALAQVYNHMILPLAREEEQRTQIRWGIYEFKKRLGRDPEGMWLPETAANPRTLEILIEEGIRFTILAPGQAEKMRRMGSAHAEWENVPQGSIDPTRPYRFFHSKDSGRSLDLFFFDRPLSGEVSFGDLLFDSKKFLDKIVRAHRAERHHPELISIACDGETFGHHKAFGERVIAFLLHEEAERHGFKRTNFAEFLEKFPPQFEVKIKAGEGTSWSCAHGVGRWKEDCGCHTGGLSGWNQKWRSPLREAVRFLEERLAQLYEKESKNFLRDPWEARDRYIELVLDRSPESRKKFFGKYAKRALTPAEEIQALKLLEMERFAMLTETSCGWFFNDVSGIETVQILRYAARALELAAGSGAAGLEKEFVDYLRLAKSNRPEVGDGAGVWEKYVKPSRILPEKVVSHFAFRKFFDLPISREEFYGYELQEGESERESAGGMTLLMGVVELTGKIIPESQKFTYAIFQKELSLIQCFVRKQASPDEFHKLNVRPLTDLRRGNAEALAHHLGESFGAAPVLLRDLFPEERDEILRVLSRQMREDYYRAAMHFYEENRPWAQLFHEAGRPVPEEFRRLIEWMMGERLLEWAKKLDAGGAFEEVLRGAQAIGEEARSSGFSVRLEPTVQFLSARLNGWIEKLFQGSPVELVERIDKILAFAKELQMELRNQIAQELFFIFAQKTLRDWIEEYQKGKVEDAKRNAIQTLLRLGAQLGFNVERYEEQLKIKNAGLAQR